MFDINAYMGMASESERFPDEYNVHCFSHVHGTLLCLAHRCIRYTSRNFEACLVIAGYKVYELHNMMINSVFRKRTEHTAYKVA